jgi:hypothetical protein
VLRADSVRNSRHQVRQAQSSRIYAGNVLRLILRKESQGNTCVSLHTAATCSDGERQNYSWCCAAAVYGEGDREPGAHGCMCNLWAVPRAQQYKVFSGVLYAQPRWCTA